MIGGQSNQSYLALERVAPGELTEIMRVAIPGGWTLNFSRVRRSSDTPFATVSEWKLPDGTALDAFCMGKHKPFRTLTLRSLACSRVAVLRYLAPVSAETRSPRPA